MGFLDSAISVFAKIGFRFEFFFPKFIGYYVGQKLKDFKQKGWIADYKVKSKRKGKYHYFFNVDLFLNMDEGGEILWLRKRKGM
jgi:hypothetical protein